MMERFFAFIQRIWHKIIGEAPPWVDNDKYDVPFHITDADLEKIEEVRRLHGLE